MKEATFNKIFNAFILGGMAVAVMAVTAFKLRDIPDAGRWMLLVSAFGSLMGVLSTVCSANGKIWTFVFGFLDVALYAVMCFVGSKFGNALLHAVYFVPMQFVGFFQWRRRGAGEKGSGIKARRLSPRYRMLAGLLLVVLSSVSFLLLRYYGKSDTPAFDAISVICNIIGQFLMSTAYMEQWVFWIGVNVASIFMWSSTLAADPSSSYALVYVVKYSFYLLNSLNGLRIWLSLSRGAGSRNIV